MEAIRKNSKPAELVLLVMLAIALVGLEVVSARLAYETLGAIASTLYWAALGINLFFIPIAFRSKPLAAVGIVIVGLVLIPYQFALAERLWRVQNEATRIVISAYEARLSTGAFPTNLADYVFQDPEAKSFIQEYRPDASVGGFSLCYRVGTESTSHCFSPKSGWTYHPD